MSSPVISYKARNDTSTSAEVAALSNVYRFILQKHNERQRATEAGGSEDVKGRSENDFHAANHSNP